MFRVTGQKNVGRVGTLILFSGKKNIILCILKGISPFKMHKIIFFSENLNKILGFARSGYPKHRYFFFFGLNRHVSNGWSADILVKTNESVLSLWSVCVYFNFSFTHSFKDVINGLE